MHKARLWISMRNEYLDIMLPDSCAVYKNDMEAEVECPFVTTGICSSTWGKTGG